MVSFDLVVVKQLCGILDEVKKIRDINETWEKRETTDIAFFTIPENGGVRSFAIGTTQINFKTGVIINPDSTKEYMNRKLDQVSQEWLHSISVDADQNLKLKILPNSTRSVDAYFSTQIPYLNYNEIEITCTVATNVKIFACTNPSAVVGQYKNPMTDANGRLVVSSISQLNVETDVAEAQTWDASLTSLLSNLNRIRYAITTMSGEAWGTFSHSIATIWGKFDATTGHKHTGAANDAPKISESDLSLTDITTNDVSITKHGFAPKAPNDASKYLDGTGAYSMPSGSGSGFFRQFWQKQGTVVAGTWAWSANGGATDFASVTGEATGYWQNSTAANLDEYKWANIFLAAGSYKITPVTTDSTDGGITEFLLGATSLGTHDSYRASGLNNVITTINFTLTNSTTGDFRVRANGKNASSSGYMIRLQRLQLEKTA